MTTPVTWTIAGGRVLGPAPFFVAGIVNCTPDSFYDGGHFFDPDQASEQSVALVDQGADIVDIGGESTRPFSRRVSAEEEKRRVLPVINRVLERRPRAVVSVDTYRAGVAAAALQAGAGIVNDVSACTFDPDLMQVVSEYRPGYVLMHSQGRPEDMQKDPSYDDVVGEVFSFFETRMNRLVQAGLPEERIVLDPGIGFGKLLEHNLRLLANIQTFFALGRPVYMGLSNKSTWGKLLDLGPDQRQTATQVATALMGAKGVPIHRVHEVADTVRTLRIVQALQEQEDG
ncbi:dihydropteroate synthase [Desulfovermiculus halophilus]|uniref:dihydropteroate synthase n=1 Tax=Desulfovermiculus halophilus TaxID=339722 RepID=UPI0004808623|nr:dihydropteroate synthase [Desulfovermiculus halophilus]